MAYNDAQKLKVVMSLEPDVYTNASTDGDSVDCKGYSSALAVFRVGTTDGNIDVLKLQESDNDSTWADISGAAWTGTDLPGNTDDDSTFAISLDLRKRKRYLRWVVSEDNTGSADAVGSIVLGTPEAVEVADQGADYYINLIG